MRKLGQSMLRLGWAMSMLGVKGAVDMLSPEAGAERSAAALDAMKEAAEKGMGEEVSGFYRAGERMQKSVLDGVSQMSQGVEVLRPDRFLHGASEILRRSADLVQKAAGGDSPADPVNDAASDTASDIGKEPKQ